MLESLKKSRAEVISRDIRREIEPRCGAEMGEYGGIEPQMCEELP